jgi:hypothetical protein
MEDAQEQYPEAVASAVGDTKERTKCDDEFVE